MSAIALNYTNGFATINSTRILTFNLRSSILLSVKLAQYVHVGNYNDSFQRREFYFSDFMLLQILKSLSSVHMWGGRWKGENGKLKLRGNRVVGDKGIPAIAVNYKGRLICLNYYRLTLASLTFNYNPRICDYTYISFVVYT